MKEQIDNLLRQDDISYTLPGRNSHMYLGKIDGVAQFVPKQYLLWTFQELHCLIKTGIAMKNYSIFFTLLIHQLHKRICTDQQNILGILFMPRL